MPPFKTTCLSQVTGNKAACKYCPLLDQAASKDCPLFDRIANAFGVSLDYLVSGGKEDSPRIDIADKELIRHMEAVDKLPAKDKEAVKAVLESFILKNRFQELANAASAS